MGIEIERKFLVSGDSWRENIESSTWIRQGYLCRGPESVVRIRLADESAFITVKGKNRGFARAEFEYGIPFEDASIMLDTLCVEPMIEKNRYIVIHEGLEWSIDLFEGDNRGLVIAEVELESVDQEFSLPEWAGKEVSGDPRYYNSNLMSNPFSTWK